MESVGTLELIQAPKLPTENKPSTPQVSGLISLTASIMCFTNLSDFKRHAIFLIMKGLTGKLLPC